MKIIIVGAGITGITTALYAKKLGFNNIYIFERTNSIGGILKDVNINNEINFLRIVNILLRIRQYLMLSIGTFS